MRLNKGRFYTTPLYIQDMFLWIMCRLQYSRAYKGSHMFHGLPKALDTEKPHRRSSSTVRNVKNKSYKRYLQIIIMKHLPMFPI